MKSSSFILLLESVHIRFKMRKQAECNDYCIQECIQYCAKVMQAKCPNFVLCSRELSTKVRAKVRAKIRGVSSDNSLEQRVIFRLIFGTSQKIRDN